MQIINPATDTLITEIAEDSREQIVAKYEKLKLGQKAWAARPLADRLQIIARYAELVKENLEDLAQTLTAEMGKPIRQSRGEINGASGRITFFLANAEKYLADEEMSNGKGMREIIRHEPLGVIGNVTARFVRTRKKVTRQRQLQQSLAGLAGAYYGFKHVFGYAGFPQQVAYFKSREG